ncbi:transposable element Tc3 transposase [Trichonephila clavipes]|nr:transposable element Tc3 transposase [Trichonephila clavipes]
MLGSRTELYIFDAGSVNGTRYCNEILLPYVRLFRGAMGLQFLFVDDNAPCHRTVAAEQLLENEDIERRRLAARTLPPVTIRELRLALQDEWAAMPQQLIDTLILSMGRRCEICLAVYVEVEITHLFINDCYYHVLAVFGSNILIACLSRHPFVFSSQMNRRKILRSRIDESGHHTSKDEIQRDRGAINKKRVVKECHNRWLKGLDFYALWRKMREFGLRDERHPL